MLSESSLNDLRIETPRLVLRRLDPRFAERFAVLLNDPGIAGMTASIPHPYGLADAEAFLASKAKARSEEGIDLQIEDRSGRLLGGLGVDAMARGLPEIGYWIGRAFWGKGIATEALNGFLERSPAPLNRRGLAAGHFTDNPASGRVLEKAGFLYTGVVERRLSKARKGLAHTRMMVWRA